MNKIGEFNARPIDEARLLSSQLLLKTHGMVVFLNLREVKDALFHTSKGQVCLDVKLFTICVRQNDDMVEAVISGKMGHAIRTAYRLKSENIHFDDVLSFIEMNCDYKDIDRKVEHIIASM